MSSTDFSTTDQLFHHPDLNPPPPPPSSTPERKSRSPARETTGKEIVALIFAKTALNEEQWAGVILQVTLTLAEELDLLRTQQSTRTRYLDLNAETGLAKVAELCISLVMRDRNAAKHSTCHHSLTLVQCTQICNSTRLASLQAVHKVEIVLQPSDLYALHREPGLAVFDMDSTLIQQEVIDELARAVGLYPQVAAITEAAMRGEAPYADFEASLRARVGLLHRVPLSIWDTLKTRVISFTPGAPELVRVLKRLGWKTAVLSGGFTPLAEWLQETLGMDYAHANHLVEDPSLQCLTGQLVDGKPIVDARRKKDLLHQIAADHHIPLSRTIAVGDGSNDLLMMHAAGLGVAFNAKPKVQLAAPCRLNCEGLLDVLYLLGRDKAEIEGLLASEIGGERG